MAQCLRITCLLDDANKILTKVQKTAHKLLLEGTVTIHENNLLIIVCGARDAIDHFIDIFHKEIIKKVPDRLEMEPFIKDKDYRGVFRIIE